jgi:hypothetical protein
MNLLMAIRCCLMRSRVAGISTSPFRCDRPSSGLGFNLFHKTDGDLEIGLFKSIGKLEAKPVLLSA